MFPLTPWTDTGTTLDQVRREMDDLLRRMFAGPTDGAAAGDAWAPRIDVEETDAALVVKADLPGVAPKDLEVAVRDGMLTLKGETQKRTEEKQKNYQRTERFVGKFFRAIPLPAGADENAITAAGENGVVTITVPKKAAPPARRIAVAAK
jgi:HSP20 family protein